jgi:adenylosuccinate synthase
VVINPASMLEEIDALIARGVAVGENLMVSDRAHVIFPWHFQEDSLLDKQCAGGEAIGTTMRGIGPCYRDKVGRSFAVRLGDLYRDGFQERIRFITQAKNQMLACLNGGTGAAELDAEEILRLYGGYAQRLKPFVGDTTAFLLDAVDAGKRILFEGAQGALLDVDHGTFPFVTSSNSSGVGVSNGSGVPGRHVTKVIGVVKAYTTRVGGGPFPTEQDNPTGQHIRDRGNEYGTVTRRPRRCGWFDAVAARYSARLSGVDVLAVMLLDVLGQLPELNLCVAYELDGRRIADFPSHVDDVRRAKPVYETVPGWQEEITHVRRIADLPENARAYLNRISTLVGRPVEIVSVGPDREQTIFADQ